MYSTALPIFTNHQKPSCAQGGRREAHHIPYLAQHPRFSVQTPRSMRALASQHLVYEQDRLASGNVWVLYRNPLPLPPSPACSGIRDGASVALRCVAKEMRVGGETLPIRSCVLPVPVLVGTD